jgi:hypothetical protein
MSRRERFCNSLDRRHGDTNQLKSQNKLALRPFHEKSGDSSPIADIQASFEVLQGKSE